HAKDIEPKTDGIEARGRGGYNTPPARNQGHNAPHDQCALGRQLHQSQRAKAQYGQCLWRYGQAPQPQTYAVQQIAEPQTPGATLHVLLPYPLSLRERVRVRVPKALRTGLRTLTPALWRDCVGAGFRAARSASARHSPSRGERELKPTPHA